MKDEERKREEVPDLESWKEHLVEGHRQQSLPLKLNSESIAII